MSQRSRILRILLIAALAWTVGFSELAITIEQASHVDEAQLADAILVLGAGVLDDGSASPALIARVDHAAGLYEAGYAPIIALTGGQLPDRPAAEADVAREILLQQGIPAEVIIYEAKSQTTVQNLEYIVPLLEERGIEDVIVVSSPFHTWRARRIVEAAGMEGYFSPAPDDPAEDKPILRVWYLTREAGAAILNLLFGI